MVCTRGRGQMEAMARLLANGNYPEITPEEANHEKLAAQSIRRELHEADETNLLEEGDMHVFDCKPMMDPLHLVCCKNCKKPVKASQYAIHAERCRSLSSTAEAILEVDGNTGHKKPPRKGRKKLQTAHGNRGTTAGEQEKFTSITGESTAASEPNPGVLNGMTLLPRDAKRNAPSIGRACVMDGSMVGPVSNYSAVATNPSEKRTKLIAAENPLISEGLETSQTTRGVTTKNHINCQEALIYRPAPLATKMYNSQRNLRLRNALNHLYHEASLKEQSSDLRSPVLVEENVMSPPVVSSPKNSSHESESNDSLPKKDAFTLPAVRKPDQLLAQSSQLLGTANGYSSAMNFSNQCRDKNFSRPAVSVDSTSMGMIRSRYLPTAYSYPGNSGTSLAVMQKSNGSVPVI